MNKKRVGNHFESLALIYLEKKNFKIIKTNYYAKGGEIDIIAIKDNILHFIEVKYRKNNKYGSAIESLSNAKIYKILRTSKIYLLENKLSFNQAISYDLLAIEGERIDFIENIFS